MNKYLLNDPWKIISEDSSPQAILRSEAIFSLGNGRMGQRANFEEDYSGPTLRGSYVAGVYYPDKTRVGWWKNGYPEYFAKVLNNVNWIGMRIHLNGKPLDLHAVPVKQFRQELDMHAGTLLRQFTAVMPDGVEVQVESLRFLSIVEDRIGALQYTLKANQAVEVAVEPYLDFDVANHDANYGEKFWEEVSRLNGSTKAAIQAKTKKLDFQVAAAMRYDVEVDGHRLTLYPEMPEREKYVANRFEVKLASGSQLVVCKYAAIDSTLNVPADRLLSTVDESASAARRKGFATLLAEQTAAWAEKWRTSDIIIDGDVEAQQAIRFNIFQLNQTYTGEDDRLNIGPKGFTGEKYGGSTYWDTEAYCLPFYLATAPPKVAENLLLYRFKQLDKAIENAQKLGFHSGAALYPMVTMNGEECHNEWEITFEEIHRNGAIAYAVYNYIKHTLDYQYLAKAGFEVLLGIARFWSQRITWSVAKHEYVMLGVTGPNEYENNVNNNWYTNLMAVWCLEYALEAAQWLEQHEPSAYTKLVNKTKFSAQETELWEHIIQHMYFPTSEDGLFLQQEGFLDKEIIPADQLDPAQRPINQHWSWDRILRSCYIKQADVLQGFYFLEDRFSEEQLRQHFDFYEPLTVHESSLSPCIHAIQAAQLGYMDKAYALYLRTARLDLDDYNKEVHEGLHITSMAGTWASVVQGFGGMRVSESGLSFQPHLPEAWKGLSFRVLFRGSTLLIAIRSGETRIELTDGPVLTVSVWGRNQKLIPRESAIWTA
jgi:maltose phosphorylase